MTERDSSALASLLERLQMQLAEPVDFSRTDPESTIAKVRLLSAAAVYFNVLAITDFGGRPGPVRQEGLFEQVVAAAFQTYRGEDPHPLPFDKAAMLMRGIIQGHPFTDANKRTGFLVAIYYLDRVGFALWPRLPTAEVVSFCRRGDAERARAVGQWHILCGPSARAEALIAGPAVSWGGNRSCTTRNGSFDRRQDSA